MSAKDEIRRNTEEVQGPAAIANSGSAGVSGAFAVMASEDFHRPGEASWSVDEIRYDEIERDRIKEDTQLPYADRARTAGAACQVRAMKAYVTNQTRHAIILAGGDGTRLSEITRRISGDSTPKQFCPVIGNTSLLEQTRLRVSLAVDKNRIFTVLNRAHERHYRDLVNEILPEKLVIQPANRGTAPAILYALMRLSEVARDTYVAVFPSDHFVSDDREFMRHVDSAFDAIESRPEMTVLLGITPHAVESGYGWIEPGELIATCSPLFRVRRFWEKPGSELADELLRAGCMWNSFVMVARVSTLIGLIMVAMPALYASFSKIHGLLGTAREPGGLERLYERIQTASFSSEVLERYPINLSVLPVHGVEWSDLGEPQRVIAVLSHLGVHPEWEAA